MAGKDARLRLWPLCILLLAACTSQAAGPPGLAEIGQPVEFGGAVLTVLSAERTEQLGSEQRLEQVSQPLRAGEGKAFIVVKVTLENKTQYRLLYQPSQFAVHDGRGTAHAASVTAGAQPLGRGDLEPTKEATGVVNFLVPQESKDFVLTYRVPNSGHSLSVRLGV